MKLISDVASVQVTKEPDGYVGLILMAGMAVTVVAGDSEITKDLCLAAARLLWQKMGSATVPSSLAIPVWVEDSPETPRQTVH
jgi:hypothetical protein